jgi:hypothetical protein
VPEKIVALGLLSQRDVDRFGDTLCGLIPLAEDTDFDDLLRELDAVELADHGNGLVIRSKLAPKR